MKVYIESYGCAANKADTNLMKNIIMSKHEIVEDPWKANAIIINTCTVRGETERSMVKRIRELEEIGRKNGSKLIVAGCMAKAQPALVMGIAPEASLISPQRINEILEVLESSGREIRIIGSGTKNLERTIENGLTVTIPIAEGCLGNCSYCIVKLARGELRSYSIEEIKRVVRKAVERGAREIRLTAQDTAAYGMDIGTNLVNLLRELLQIPGEYIIRIGMMTPNNTLKIIDDLMDIYDDDRIYKFMHIPLQSGDDEILKLMNRKYSTDDYKTIVRKFRSKYPTGFIATDIISGFPMESEEAHKRTIKVIEETKPDKVNVAKYSPRPHTKAAALPQLPESIRSRRCREVIEVSRRISLERNMMHVGRIEDVLVLKVDGGIAKARMKNYRLVKINGCGEMLGKMVKVKITEAKTTYLIGELTS
ncbi:MAG: tRNA (N(6)-L-threonylcarbamoyladenosine(37)-C(2))-methylthiotransferase [archaeon GBS-70-058]|nr:tRNA (N(6)-L-threonylcarbamoyladenosine(37)-C(2))-methylthiotransferase [Candidatus Culexarchaeum nevadense]